MKEYNIRIPASVTKVGRNVWEARVSGGGACDVSGSGASEKEAREDLERNLAWVAHHVGCFVVKAADSSWVVSVAYHHHTWQARRLTGDGGLSEGSTIFTAPTYSRARATVEAW